MNGSEFDKPKLQPGSNQGSGQSEHEKSDAFQTQSPPELEVLLQLFNLLEQYAPIWYTEEHRNRAVAALRGFQGQ
jgi:hypothetical protein